MFYLAAEVYNAEFINKHSIVYIWRSTVLYCPR